MTVGHLWQGRRPPSPSASPPSLPLSLFKVEPELSPSPLHSHHAFTRSSTTYTQHRRWKSSPPVKGPFLLLVFLPDDATVAQGVFSFRRFMSSTTPGAPTLSAGVPLRARRRRQSSPLQLLPGRQAHFLCLWVVSFTFPPFFDLHTHRSTDEARAASFPCRSS
jgi:hypothetical protein